MSNRFKNDIELEEGEVEREVQPEVREKAELPRNFVTQVFTEGVISKQAATDMLPFFIYISFIICISYFHLCRFLLFFFKVQATTDIYTLSLHDALPISNYCRFCG